MLTPGFAANEDDTTCLPTIQQFIMCIKNDFPACFITILAFQYPFINGEHYWNGIKVISLGGNNKPGLARVNTWRRAMVALTKIHRDKPIDGMLSLFITECALVGKLFSRWKKIKHYTWLLGQDTKPTNKYVRRINPQPAELIAMSNVQNTDLFQSFGITAKHIIENGINESFFPPFNNGIRNIDIIGAGSFIPLKQYGMFIEIIHALKIKGLELNAVLCGDGVLKPELVGLAEKLGVNGNVHFPGLTTHSQTLEYMNNSKIFLHTSRAEASSTVLMEALYSGCKTVAFAKVGHKITEQFYHCVNKEMMVEKIYELLIDEKQEYKQFNYNSMHDSAREMMQLFFAR